MADGQNIAAGPAQISHHRSDLILLLAEADHDTGFGDDRRLELLDPQQQLERPAVGRLRPHTFIKTGHRLDVVIEHIGALTYDDPESLRVPRKIRGQHLHPGRRRQTAKSPDGGRELLRSAVGQIIPGDRGDHHIAQPHDPGGLGHTLRLIPLHRPGKTSAHGAETAMPGADRPQDHESGRTAGETFPFVGAAGLFADGMETKATEK